MAADAVPSPSAALPHVPVRDRVVVVAGATGELGASLVRTLRQHGARVALAVRKPWQVAKMIETYGNDRLLVSSVPAGDAEACAGFVKGATDALGPIDALFCANGAFRGNPIGRDPNDELDELLEANLRTGAALARAVVGPMKRRRTGSLVFVGSAGVGGPGAGLVNYLASKAALHEWVRALADDVRDTGVRVGAVLPTTIDTSANRAAMPTADRSGWLSLDAVASAMLEVAFGQPGPGPLYPVPVRG